MCPLRKFTNEEAILIKWDLEVRGPERVEKIVPWRKPGKHLDFVVNFLPYITSVRYAEEETSFKARIRLEPVYLGDQTVRNTAFKGSWIKVNEDEKIKMGNHLDALESDVFELSLKRSRVAQNEKVSKINIQAWVEVASLPLPLSHPLLKYHSPLSYGNGVPDSRLLASHNETSTSKVARKSDGEFKSRLKLVTITKLNQETLKKFGEYVDTGKLFEPADVNEAQHLYDAASQCSLDKLKKYCIRYLAERMNVENVVSMLTFANLRSEVELQEAALNLITKCKESPCRLRNWRLLMQNRPDLALLVTQRITSNIRARALF